MLVELELVEHNFETKREAAAFLLDVVERLGMLPPLQWGKKPSKVKEVCKWDDDV